MKQQQQRELYFFLFLIVALVLLCTLSFSLLWSANGFRLGENWAQRAAADIKQSVESPHGCDCNGRLSARSD